MPPRHAYWTILVDDQPTAFRAHEAEELLPTLNRLREKNASAVLKWFERGQLFDSRDAARDAGFGRGERRWEGPRPDRQSEDERGDRRRGEQRTGGAQTAPRDKNWRPGGDRDPRQKYRDAKKAKWNRFKQNIRDAHDRRQRQGSDVRPESFSPPHGDPLREEISHRPRQEWREDRRGAPSRPHGDKMRSRPPREEWRRDDRDRTRSEREQRSRSSWPDREHSQPQDRGRTPGERKPFTPKRGPRKPWGSKPGAPSARKPWGSKPPGAAGRKPWSGKPAGSGRKPWGSKPAGRGRKPWGPKPQARPAHKPWDSKRKRRQDDDE